MDLGQVKYNMNFRSFPETQELSRYFFLIKKRKFILSGIRPPVCSRLLIKLVIIAEAALIQQLEHHFTTFTTEHMILRPNPFVRTVFPAMITLHLFFGELWHGKKDKITSQRMQIA